MLDCLIILVLGVVIGVVVGMFICEISNSHRDLW